MKTYSIFTICLAIALFFILSKIFGGRPINGPVGVMPFVITIIAIVIATAVGGGFALLLRKYFGFMADSSDLRVVFVGGLGFFIASLIAAGATFFYLQTNSKNQHNEKIASDIQAIQNAIETGDALILSRTIFRPNVFDRKAIDATAAAVQAKIKESAETRFKMAKENRKYCHELDKSELNAPKLNSMTSQEEDRKRNFLNVDLLESDFENATHFDRLGIRLFKAFGLKKPIPVPPEYFKSVELFRKVRDLADPKDQTEQFQSGLRNIKLEKPQFSEVCGSIFFNLLHKTVGPRTEIGSDQPEVRALRLFYQAGFHLTLNEKDDPTIQKMMVIAGITQ